jgi:hypothetical protein
MAPLAPTSLSVSFASYESGGSSGEGTSAMLQHLEGDFIGACERVKGKVAVDPDSVAHVVHPKYLQPHFVPEPNTTGTHFTGAGGDMIEKFGTCLTELLGEHGTIGCNWDLAGVSRALHSVSKVCGPEDGAGKQDIIFNNTRAVVVPPGVLDAVMKHVEAIAEHKREGSLYFAEMTMSSFRRQGQGA